MEIHILREAGYEEALKGMVMSFETECPLYDVWTDTNDMDHMEHVARKLYNKDGGHNKFLEHIMLWVDIRASLAWWKQADTYRVGMSKLSKSTMHTLMRRPIVQEDFAMDIPQVTLNQLNQMRETKQFDDLVMALPSGYLQTRRCCFNYKTLRNMINQRHHHKMYEWREFCECMSALVDHPELLERKKK